MSDTTGWTYTTASRNVMHKNLPHCRIEIYQSRGAWAAWVELTDKERPTKAEAQRLAHALARALEDVK